MADDISARITIAIENASAVQQCEQVEDALGRVTQARRRDLSVAEQSSQQTTDNTSAVQEETAAIEQQTKARKKSRQELEHELAVEKELARQRAIPREEQERREREGQKRRDDYNRKFDEAVARDEAKKNSQSNKTGGNELDATIKANKQRMEEERFAAEKLAYEREKLEARAQDVIARRSFVSEQALKKEILQTNLLIAKKQQLLAVQQQLALKDKIAESQKALDTEEGRGRKADLRVVNLHRQDLDKYNQQLLKANLAAKTAESQIRKLNNALVNLGRANGQAAHGGQKNTATTLSTFKAIRTGILRLAQTAGVLRGVPLRGAGGLGAGGGAGGGGAAGGGGMFAKLGGGAGFAAAGMMAAFAAPALLATWGQLRGERLREEQEMRIGNLDSQRQSNDRFEAEAQKRQEMLSVLEANTQKERLTLTERVKQDAIIKKLSNSMHGMNIEVDSSTGKIRNMSEIMLKTAMRDRKQKEQRAESEFKNIEAELNRVESIVNNAGLADQVGDFFTDELKMAKQQLPDLRRRREEAYNKLMEARNQNSPEAIRQLRRERQAALQDKTNSLNKRGRELQAQYDEQDMQYRWRDNASYLRQREEYKDRQKLQELNDRIAYFDFRIGNTNNAEAKNIFREQQLKLMAERNEVRERMLATARFNDNVNKEIKSIKEEAKLRELVNKGLSREAYYLRIEQEAEKKVKEQGWSKEQAKQWAAERIEADKAGKERAKASDFGAGKQLQSTVQNVVWASSAEAFRLQNRMLVDNTPQKQMLDVTKKQYQAVVDISRNLKNTKTGDQFEFVTF